MERDELLALRASAGSGKTFALTLRYLALLFKGAHPSEILTLTFTRKAALEMKERITQALAALQQGEENPYLLGLVEAGITKEAIQEKRVEVYWRFLQADLRITTIDAFLHSIVRKFCWYIGIPHDFTIASVDEEAIMEDFLSRLSAKDQESLLELSVEESKGVEAILRLLRDLWHKEGELSQEYRPALREFDSKELMEAAFKIKNRVLGEEGASTKAKEAVDFEDVEGVLRRGKTWLTKDSLVEYNYFKKLSMGDLDGELWRIKELLVDYFNAKESQLLGRLLRLLGIFKESLERWSQKERILGFDEVTQGAYRLLGEKIDREFLYFRLDGAITHILIDEFQDTSLLQFKILEPLIEEIKSGISRSLYRTFFYVGDMKQSIYRFRGSHALLFEWASRGMKVKELPNNYRSCAVVVDFINQVFAPHYKGYSPQIPQKSGGFVAVLQEEEVLESLKKELGFLLEQGITPSDVAILVFSNDDVLRVAECLKDSFEGLKVVTETSARLLEQREVRALHRALFYLQEGKEVDGVSFLSLIGEPPHLDRLEFLRSLNSLKSSQILLALMEHFKLFSASARRFLEISLEYPLVDELLLRCKSLDEPLSAEELEGVRILTIHKSKGLEFPHVIVMDRLSNPSNQSPALFYDYKGINLRAILYRLKERENFDSTYARALEKEKESKAQDLLNMLYVAFTRAKESLHILQKSEKGAMESLALESCTKGEISPGLPPKPSAILPSKGRTFVSKDFGRQKDFLKKEESQRVYAPRAVYYGEAFHLCLEHRLHYASPQEKLMTLILNQYGHFLNKDDDKEIITKCMDVTNGNLLRPILNQGRVKCEIPFLENGKMRRIDLLIEGEERVFVVDYKSTSILKEGYYQQVELYKTFASKALQKPSFGFLLIYGEEIRLIEV